MKKPQHWFRAVCEADELKTQPGEIEYLRIWTGETFIHSFGTAFWCSDSNRLDKRALMDSGITHWRIKSD